MTELERYKKALEVVMQELRGMGLDYAPMVEHIQRKVDATLNPPPVYEEVEISRWECDACGHVHKSPKAPAICNGAIGDGWCNGKDCFTLLSGTRKVEKPQPRERSVSVEAEVSDLNKGAVYTKDLGGENFGMYPFKKHPAIHGKRGVLTFTWQE